MARQTNSAVTMARGLGWFSIGLGVAELLAPRAMSRATGLPANAPLVAGYGLREIATGVGILASEDPRPWILGRIGGDVLDLGTLGAGLADRRTDRSRTLAGLAAVAAVTVLDVICARALAAPARPKPGPVRDYSDRSGWTKPLDEVRGSAREAGQESRTAEAVLRP